MATGVEDPKLRAAYNAAVTKYGKQTDPHVIAARAALEKQRQSVGLNVNAGGAGQATKATADATKTASQQAAEAKAAAGAPLHPGGFMGGGSFVGGAPIYGTPVIAPTAQAKAATLDPAALQTGVTVDPTGDNQYREMQLQLANSLQARANGTSPSVAALQYKQAADQFIAAQNAQIAAASGGMNPALALRQAGLNTAGIQQQSAQQSAINDLAEQQAAQQAIGGIANQGRVADQSIAAQNAQLAQNTQAGNQQAVNTRNLAQGGFIQAVNLQNPTQINAQNLAQAQLQLQQQGNNQNAVVQSNVAQGGDVAGVKEAAIGAKSKVDAANIGAASADFNTATNAAIAAANGSSANGSGYGTGTTGANNNAVSGGQTIAGSTISGGAQVGAAALSSDERVKTRVSTAYDDIDEFLKQLYPAKFDYKEPESGMEGQNVGVMAQDMEKSDAGKSAVVETPKGKAIDLRRGLGLVLAAQAKMHRDLEELRNGRG